MEIHAVKIEGIMDRIVEEVVEEVDIIKIKKIGTEGDGDRIHFCLIDCVGNVYNLC